MPAANWKIAGLAAALQSASLTASLSIDRPADGLRIESLRGEPISGVILFGVQLESGSASRSAASSAPSDAANPLATSSTVAPIDCFIRGDDCVATYAETADRPFRTQIYWRLIDCAMARADSANSDCSCRAVAPIAALELIVSVQTSRLDIESALAVCTTFGHVASWQLLDAAEDCESACGTAAGGQSAATRRGPLAPSLSPATGSGEPARPESPAEGKGEPESLGASTKARGEWDSPGCCVIRPVGAMPSYVEIVHPADFRQTTIDWMSESPPVVRLAHRLFAERLEKGVILRSRIRGLFVPRGHDEELARREYRRFAQSALPLTA